MQLTLKKIITGLTIVTALVVGYLNIPTEQVQGYSTEGLVGYWALDDNLATTNVVDSSGQGNNGTFSHNTNTHSVVSRQQRALYFDGTDWVGLANTASADYEAMTISAWIKRTSTATAWKTPLHRNNGTSVGTSMFFIATAGTTHEIVSTIGAATGIGYTPGSTGIISQVGTWYHVVCSWDGTTAKTYVNNVKKTSYALSSADYATANKAAVTRIGSSGDGVGYLFGGDIDDVRIYDRALSAEEISHQYFLGSETRLKNCTIKNAVIK